MGKFSVKSFITFLVSASIISAGILFYFNINKEKDTDNVDLTESQDSRDILDSNPNPIDTPILYDFVYSTIGHKSDMQGKSFGNSFALMVKNDQLKDNKVTQGTAHILRIFPQDFLPPIATGNVAVRFSESGWNNVKSSFKGWPKDSKFEEGKYTLYIIREVLNREEKDRYTYVHNDGAVEWNGIDLASLDYPKGWLQENSEKGWSSEWIRKEPYKTMIADKEFIGADVDDEFFDKFKLHEMIELDSISDTSGYDTRTVRVIGTDLFETIDGPAWKMSLEQTNAQLKEDGFKQIDR